MHSTNRLPGLDLLRAIAVVWVMLFHSFLVGGLGPTWSWLSRFGWMGVDLFFVLSGFLIGTQVLAPLAKGEKLSFSDFYLRRAFRILPAYLAVLLLYLLWPGFREAPGLEPWWKFLTFTLNLSIDDGRNAAFSHAWSLCVEEHFYALFPILAMALTRRPAAWKFATLGIGIALAGMALRTAIWTHADALDPTMKSNWFVEDIYYPTWNRLDGLLCGVALAAWKAFRPQSWCAARRYANLVLVAGLLVMVLCFQLFQNRVGLMANAIGWPILSFGLGLLVFAGAERDTVIGKYQLPFVGWLAAASYSLYLMHKAVYHLVQAHWGPSLAQTGLWAFLVYASAALFAGALLHHAVERPCLRRRQQLTARRDGALAKPEHRH
jgi:peptidoglycan/LPS O-acetylase OafA/YrhL